MGEKIVEAKEIFTTEVLKPIPKIQFWEVIKEKQAVEEEDFVETSKTEIVVVEKGKSVKSNRPTGMTMMSLGKNTQAAMGSQQIGPGMSNALMTQMNTRAASQRVGMATGNRYFQTS